MERFCISIEVNSPKESSNVGGGQNGIRKINGTLDLLATPCLFDFRLIRLLASSRRDRVIFFISRPFNYLERTWMESISPSLQGSVCTFQRFAGCSIWFTTRFATLSAAMRGIYVSQELERQNREWGMGNREWGMGNWESAVGDQGSYVNSIS